MDKIPESRHNSSRTLVVSSLWLHLGLVGATVLAAGLLQSLNGDPRLPWAPVVAFLGGVLAAASWRRGFAVLEEAERASGAAADASGKSTPRAQQSDRIRRERPASPIPLQSSNNECA